MSREETNRIKYIIALVAEFAAKFSIGEKQAFNYLKRFKEMAYLSEFYDLLHTLHLTKPLVRCLQSVIETAEIKCMKLTDSQIKMMQEDMLSELVMLVMERWHYSANEALDTIYNSDTFLHLSDKNTGLYYQSPGYVYSFLDNELRKGCFC